MKKLLGSLLIISIITVFSGVFSGQAQAASQWQTVTIDADQVDSDLTDFPVYIDLADLDVAGSDFWDTTNCTDIRVFKSDGTTELPREIVDCDTGTNTGELHVLYDGTLSSTVDTELQIHYDGTSSDYATDATFGAENVWTEYTAVYHYETDASDSTSNGYDGTVSGATLQSGGGYEFTGSDFISVNDAVAVAIEDTGTIFAITDSDDWSALDGHLFDSRGGGSDGWDFYFGGQETPVGSLGLLIDTGDFVFADVSLGAGSGLAITHGVYTGSNLIAYANNVSASNAQTGNAERTTTPKIGNQANNADPLGANEILHEVRFSTTAFSADWVDAEYTNQNTPTTFYTVSTEQSAGGGEEPAGNAAVLIDGGKMIVGGGRVIVE